MSTKANKKTPEQIAQEIIRLREEAAKLQLEREARIGKAIFEMSNKSWEGITLSDVKTKVAELM